jgi:hypothetical protein
VRTRERYLSEVAVEQVFVTGIGDAVDLRVGRHDATSARLRDGRLERRQEECLQVARSDVSRRSVESALRDRVRGVVLGFGCCVGSSTCVRVM